jgi:hypothetical protein
MKIEIKQIVEVIGVSSIVISLLFLAYQTNQSNRIAIATAEIEINSIYAGVNEIWIESQPLRDAYYKASSNGGVSDLSPEERQLLTRYVLRYTNAFSSREAAYRNGVLSTESFNRVFNDIDALVADPVFGDSFRIIVDRYTASETNPLIVYIRESLE